MRHDIGFRFAVCTSANKGERKKNMGSARLLVDLGLEGDAHAGFAHRQVSLLALESIEKMRQMGLDVNPGDFAENITATDLQLTQLPVGARPKIGDAVLEVTRSARGAISAARSVTRPATVSKF